MRMQRAMSSTDVWLRRKSAQREAKRRAASWGGRRRFRARLGGCGEPRELRSLVAISVWVSLSQDLSCERRPATATVPQPRHHKKAIARFISDERDERGTGHLPGRRHISSLISAPVAVRALPEAGRLPSARPKGGPRCRRTVTRSSHCRDASASSAARRHGVSAASPASAGGAGERPVPRNGGRSLASLTARAARAAAPHAPRHREGRRRVRLPRASRAL
jgi:hypothetical protein